MERIGRKSGINVKERVCKINDNIQNINIDSQFSEKLSIIIDTLNFSVTHNDVKIGKFFLSITIDTFWFLSIIIDSY